MAEAARSALNVIATVMSFFTSPFVSAAGSGARLSLGGALKGTGTVYDSIKATQAIIPGTAIPKSFEIASKGGEFWVHPNATKHMVEYLARNGGLSPSSLVRSQLILTSFRQAINQASAQGIRYGKLMKVGRWRLVFSKGRPDDILPVIKHAIYK